MEFAISSHFESEFERFAESHASVFLKSLDMALDAEHPLEWHDVFLEYLHTFEGKIERFIESTGHNITDFYLQCRDILDDGETFGAQRFFLEALIATSQYENFVALMKGEMHKYVAVVGKESLKGEEKNGSGDEKEGEEKEGRIGEVGDHK